MALLRKFELRITARGTANGGATWRIDTTDEKQMTYEFVRHSFFVFLKKGVIADPTLRFGTGLSQPGEDAEKKNLCQPTIHYYKDLYGLDEIEAVDLLIGSRGTIANRFKDFCTKYGFSVSLQKLVAQAALRGHPSTAPLQLMNSLIDLLVPHQPQNIILQLAGSGLPKARRVASTIFALLLAPPMLLPSALHSNNLR